MTTNHTKGASNARYRKAFWGAAIITIAAWLLPFGDFVLYPLSLLGTWAHEMGHGLTAILVGGRFHKLEVLLNLSGLATTSNSGPISAALVSAGGLVGAPILGALIVAVGSKSILSRGILFSLAGIVALSTVLWVRNAFGLVALPVLAASIGVAAWRLNAERRFIAVQLMGIQLALSSLRNWEYLFMADAKIGGCIIRSDVSSISHAIGGPYWLWGALIVGLNLALLYGAYRLTFRRLSRDNP